MRKLTAILILTLLPGMAMAMPPLSDAITITSAASGKVLSEATVTVASLTNPQKTALLAFVTSLGAWPGVVGNITTLTVWRVPQFPNILGASMTGLIVHNDATAAVAQQTSGAINGIIGIVP